jgi:hypothetical protein
LASNIPLNLIPNEPSLVDLLTQWKKDVLLTLNCHHIGTIQSFNATNQTASVTINYVKTFQQFNTQTGLYAPISQNYTILAEAPVITLRGGKAALTFPIAAGDECLVLFNDRDMDNWFAGGTGSPNATGRLHAFSDAMVLVGLRSLANVLTNYDTVRAVLSNGTGGTTMVGVGPTLIKIANSTTTLNTLLQSLVTDVKNLVSATAGITVTCAAPGSPSSPPLNVAAINAVTSSLTSLASQISGLLE